MLLTQDPLRSGIRGWSLIAAVLPATLVFAVLGLALFPSGTYPRIALALPGILAGGAFLYVLGFITFYLPKIIAVPLCLAVALVGIWLSGVVLSWLE
jgi:hypothetical protein